MAIVLIVNSSFRSGSNSSALGAAIADGAKSAGHQVDVIDIGRLNIGPCRGCYGCLAPGADYCVRKDDMNQFYPKVKAADVIIMAFPIYWFTMGGQMKQFIDRCFAVAINPVADEKSSFASKKIGAAIVYGDPDALKSGAINAVHTLQDICGYTGAQWVGAIHYSAYEPGQAKEEGGILEQALHFGAKL